MSIVVICRVAIIVLMIFNLLLACATHGKMIGYVATKSRTLPDGTPQLLEGEWKFADCSGTIIGTVLWGALLYGAGVFG
jgi:hypothetical protein